jgi:superkiller protein 3
VSHNDFESAADAFEEAVATAPNDAHARYNLALALQQLGETDSAVLAYLRAIYLDPGLVEAYRNLGHLYRERDEDERALEAFRGANELDNSDDEIYTNIGDLYLELGFYDDAALAYRQAQIVNPNNSLAAERLRETREETERQTAHIADLERDADAHPHDLERYERLCDAYLLAHREHDALNVANQMVALAPTSPGAYETQALVHETMNSEAEAAAAWQRVTELAPEDIEAWERLANWRQAMEDLAGAIDAYNHALKLDPEAVSARFNQADALREAQRYDDAIAIYRELVHQFVGAASDDDDPLAEGYTGLTASLNLAGRYSEALEAADEFLERFPNDPEASYEKAAALDGLDKNHEAIPLYERAVELDMLNAGLRNDLASAYLTVGRAPEAADMAESAIALEPDFASAYETLAQALLALGRTNEAEAAAQRAAELHAALDEGSDASQP